mmetsp:Transcript_10473/g.22587  ORF Transcript_10473/g.22587 Transcript_10473/m.22587 type:complete len:235 (+) Transcript_10473:1032-1736(+)
MNVGAEEAAAEEIRNSCAHSVHGRSSSGIRRHRRRHRHRPLPLYYPLEEFRPPLLESPPFLPRVVVQPHRQFVADRPWIPLLWFLPRHYHFSLPSRHPHPLFLGCRPLQNVPYLEPSLKLPPPMFHLPQRPKPRQLPPALLRRLPSPLSHLPSRHPALPSFLPSPPLPLPLPLHLTTIKKKNPPTLQPISSVLSTAKTISSSTSSSKPPWKSTLTTPTPPSDSCQPSPPIASSA